jgi:FixJ family two-component response regulator
MSQDRVIHVVDDDEAFQTAVARLLRAVGHEVRTYSTAGDFLLRRSVGERGCLLLDIQMPGPSGVELLEALHRQGDSWPVIFVSGNADVPSTVRAMKMGVVDFLLKPVRREILLNAIEQAFARDLKNQVAQDDFNQSQALHAKLSPREREVFGRVVAGRMNKEIAADLGVSERTIKSHRASLMSKLRVVSLAELIHLADKLHTGSATVSEPRAFVGN